MATITERITATIAQSKPGTIFFTNDFAQGGNDAFIRRVLSQFSTIGKIERLSYGIYIKPIHTRLGTLKPSVTEIVNAIAERDNAKVLPCGSTAMNKLGLSTQVPMNEVYITSGSGRELQIGKKTIIFKRSVPKNFAYRGNLLPIMVQSLKSIGKNNVTTDHISQITKLLRENPESETFEHDINLAPEWIKKILYKIHKTLNNE